MNQKPHKILFKTTTLFGFVEVLRMALKVATNMGASYFLGPKGIGMLGLIENTVQLISSFTNFGIQFTGVQNIASKLGGDEVAFHKAIKNVKLFSLLTGLLAALVSILGAQLLSELTFDTKDYTYWFIALSVYFICSSYIQVHTLFLEAIQNFQKLIRINVVLNIISTIVVLACYYLYNIEGVLIAMLVNSIIGCVVFFYLKLVPNVKITYLPRERSFALKDLMKSGSLLAINTFIGFLCFYVIRTYFKTINGDLLGFYHAAVIILVSYLGMLFIAMGKFFFPRLSQIYENKTQTNVFINSQLELNFLVILPAILVVYLLGEPLIELLFTTAFKPVYAVLVFGLASILFKGFNYAVGYLLLSHKNYTQYFYINLLSDVVNVGLTLMLYNWFGLLGIGLAFLINYMVSSIYIYSYVSVKYSYHLSKSVMTYLLTSCLTIGLVIFLHLFAPKAVFNWITVILLLLSTLFSAVKIDAYLFDATLLKKLKKIF